MSEGTVKPAFRRSAATLAVLVMAVVFAIGYSLHERSAARQMAAQNAQVSAALQQTRSEIEALTAKLSTISQSTTPQTPRVSASAERNATVHIRPQTMRVRRPAHRVDDPRWSKIQSQLDEQGRQIESTRNDLAGARTELQGSIARTHDELVVLQKKGERNYYEFDIQKSSQFQRNGPLGIRLRKANTKHQYVDLQLMVDDVDLTKKHVNLCEPVMFYTADGAQPAELVINSITKDHIRGYISEPKYRRTELTAMSTAAPQNETAPTTGAPNQNSSPANGPVVSSRRKLPLPR